MRAENWSFLTNHARVLLSIAQDPGARLRDIADSLGITERSAYGIVTDLTDAGYIVKHKEGRRNRYHIQSHLPLPEPGRQGNRHRRHPGRPHRRGRRRELIAAASVLAPAGRGRALHPLPAG